MKLKGVLLAGAALIVCGISNSANASERLSVYEVQGFVSKLSSAINNMDPLATRDFLNRNIASNATFSETLNNTWVDPRVNGYYQAWNGYYASPYYRYPHGYTYYNKPVSHSGLRKAGMINKIEHKKSVIPRYHQTMSVLSTRMPADASSATVDVNLREFGLNYAAAPYGLYHGQKVEHANSQCQLNLNKVDGRIVLRSMNCNTMLHSPYL